MEDGVIFGLVLLMSFAVAEDGSQCELHAYSDNWSAFQTFVDAHSSIFIPAGDWWFSRPVNVGNRAYELTAPSVEATILRNVGAFGGPVLGIGAAGTYAGSAAYGPADGTIVRGMTLWQQDESTAHCKCLYNIGASEFTAENIRVRGSSYEGIVSGSDLSGVTLRNIEAWDCGNGGPAYTLSTAGINATSVDLLIEDFVTLRCGQGVETGNTRVTVRRGLVTSPGSGEPSIGVNVGSSVYGVWRTTVEDVTISGYDSAMQVGNGVGRIAGVYLRRLKIYDDGVEGISPITFSGGTLDNTVPHSDQGPTTEGSYIEDCELHITAPHQGGIGYNSGIVDNSGLYGREPLVIQRNMVYMELDDPSEQTAPILFVAGEVGAAVDMFDNQIFGLPTAPIRGDIATFTNVANPVVPNMPTLTIRGNIAYGTNGRSRPFSILKEA